MIENAHVGIGRLCLADPGRRDFYRGSRSRGAYLEIQEKGTDHVHSDRGGGVFALRADP